MEEEKDVGGTGYKQGTRTAGVRETGRSQGSCREAVVNGCDQNTLYKDRKISKNKSYQDDR